MKYYEKTCYNWDCEHNRILDFKQRYQFCFDGDWENCPKKKEVQD